MAHISYILVHITQAIDILFHICYNLRSKLIVVLFKFLSAFLRHNSLEIIFSWLLCRSNPKPPTTKEVPHGTDRNGRDEGQVRGRAVPDPLRAGLPAGLHEPVGRALRRGYPFGCLDADQSVPSWWTRVHHRWPGRAHPSHQHDRVAYRASLVQPQPPSFALG